MSDFLSKYTGQEIETILGSVGDKLNKTDLVTTYVNDSQSPAAVSLAFDLDERIKTINLDLSQKYMRIDQGAQTVNGAKTFASTIVANAGMTVPKGAAISIADDPVQPTHTVNLSFMRKHGVSTDTASETSGLAISILPSGYNGLQLDVNRLTSYIDTAQPVSFPILATDGLTYSWRIDSLLDFILKDTRTTSAYVTTTVFNSFTDANTQALAGKVSTTTYATDMNNINQSLASKQDLAKTATVVAPASGSITTDVNQVNCTTMLITATWGTVIDIIRVTIGRDGTVFSESLIKKSSAGTITVTATIVAGKIRVSFANANTTTAASIDYKITSSF